MATDKEPSEGAAPPQVDEAGRQVSFTVLASVVGMALLGSGEPRPNTQQPTAGIVVMQSAADAVSSCAR